MMVALIADVAIKAVTQNTAFLAEDFNSEDDFIPSFLKRTPGLILIDDEDFDQARQAITKLTDLFGLDPEITRARSLIKFLEN